jgi:hypothetical protein
MAAAFGWGALGAAALLLGVLIAYQLAPSRQVIAVVMALAPLQPALDQLGDGAGAATALLAPVQVLQELGLDLLGLAPGGLGLPTDLATEPSLAAGEGVAAGEHLDLETASAPSMSFHLEVKE